MARSDTIGVGGTQSFERMIDVYSRRLYLPYTLCVLTYESSEAGSWHTVLGFHTQEEAVTYYNTEVEESHRIGFEWGIFDNDHDSPRWTSF